MLLMKTASLGLLEVMVVLKEQIFGE